MVDRPYFQSSVGAMATIAGDNWDSIASLQALLSELRHRTTARAQRLERDVAARVLALGGDIDSEAVSGPVKGKNRTSSSTEAPSQASKQLIDELKLRVLSAEQQVRDVEEQLGAAQAEIARLRDGDPGSEDATYTKIGLHRSCPNFVFDAVRRAFRKEYHPDSLSDRPKPEQLAAQEKFKEYEQLFSQLQAARR